MCGIPADVVWISVGVTSVIFARDTQLESHKSHKDFVKVVDHGVATEGHPYKNSTGNY